MSSEDFNSMRAAEPVGAFPHAKRVGDFLFVSGIGPRERGVKGVPGVELGSDGKVLRYDFERQVRGVFQNVRQVVEDAGARWEDIIDVTVFLTDMKRDFPAFNRRWPEYFPTNPPCRTTVEVGALPTPIAIELKCIAYVGGKS